jgi:hypothetical protein
VGGESLEWTRNDQLRKLKRAFASTGEADATSYVFFLDKPRNKVSLVTCPALMGGKFLV